jgi:hypothetical protein
MDMMATEDMTDSFTTPIKRVEKTSDDTPPWTGITFTLPVDSDKLAEDLKRAYPDCSTLRERKHMAAIDFLQFELHQMQSKISGSSEPVRHHFDSSLASDPRRIESDDHIRQSSVASSLSLVSTNQDLLSPKESLMRSRDEMVVSAHESNGFAREFVFSVSDGRTLQPKTKRRMTREEKIVYRKTRMRGACSKCRRQKGKVCTLLAHISRPSAY